MIEHYIPLKLNHEELQAMRDDYAELVELQTQEQVQGREAVRLFQLEDQFGAYDWLVARIVNAVEAR